MLPNDWAIDPWFQIHSFPLCCVPHHHSHTMNTLGFTSYYCYHPSGCHIIIYTGPAIQNSASNYPFITYADLLVSLPCCTFFYYSLPMLSILLILLPYYHLLIPLIPFFKNLLQGLFFVIPLSGHSPLQFFHLSIFSAIPFVGLCTSPLQFPCHVTLLLDPLTTLFKFPLRCYLIPL